MRQKPNTGIRPSTGSDGCSNPLATCVVNLSSHLTPPHHPEKDLLKKKDHSLTKQINIRSEYDLPKTQSVKGDPLSPSPAVERP